MIEVTLRSSAGVAHSARLREPCARDELTSSGAGPTALTAWLAGLLEAQQETELSKEYVWSLSLADRDRLAAATHALCFGDRVASTVVCATCSQPFELGFSLADLLQALEPEPATHLASGPDGRGVYGLADGREFRLPSAADERALAGLASDAAAKELARRCVVSGDASQNPDALERAMNALAPLIDLDLTGICALCGAEQKVHFDMVSFFQSSLASERRLLIREIHRLAAVYHWSWAEIIALPRSMRQAHVALIESERSALRAPS